MTRKPDASELIADMAARVERERVERIVQRICHGESPAPIPVHINEPGRPCPVCAAAERVLREQLAHDIATQRAETLAALKYVHPECASAVNMAFEQALALVRGVGEAKP